MNIEKYYESRGVDLKQVVVSGLKRKGVRKELIYEGAEKLYGKILKGDVIPDVALSSRIIAEAVAMDRVGDVDVDSYNMRISRLEEHITLLEEDILNTGWVWMRHILTKERKLWGWWKNGSN